MENYHEIDFTMVGARIRDARRALGLTQEKAARHTFITAQFWSLLESGRQRASVNTYRQITAVLGLTLDDLFYPNAEAMRVQKSFSNGGLLLNCTESEKIILSETILFLKKILQQNRR